MLKWSWKMLLVLASLARRLLAAVRESEADMSMVSPTR
jgi:hypothetical protein